MHRKLKFELLSLVITGLVLNTAEAWSPKYAPIMTDWAQLVDTNQPLPEYPRPQMVRTEWMNLNGLWQFQPGSTNDPVPVNQTLSGEILVPFPMESALSGVMEHHARSWYRRTFFVPSGWAGQRILLHFGAVDWESEVFINGQSVGIHKGGYDAFSYDITPYLNGTGAQELIVRVYDATDALGMPRGKQTLYPGGIMYTACSGIWQTVWLEPVAATSISGFKLITDIDQQRLLITLDVTGPTNGISVNARARVGANWVSLITTPLGNELTLPVSSPNLWSPTNPFLYDLDLALVRGGTNVDAVVSYFGMRKISRATNNGFVKMLLNNQFVFQFGPLDQGFWPDGVYTAPTDDALKSDIEQAKVLGYNMIRKHIKVEPARWYYWADKLGMLVWQDMPSANSYTGNPQPLDIPQFETELVRMVTNHWNHPSIISWVIFNESQGQHRTEEYVQIVKALDPTRLINQGSGGSHYGVGDILDTHSYPNPGCPSSLTQAVVCGEFGGVGLPITNHTWAPGWGYVAATNSADLTAKFEDFCFQLSGFVNNQGLSAAVYTEITDVEIELNGFLTYDRKVRKLDPADTRRLMGMAGAPVTMTTVVPTSNPNAQTWKWRTTTPPSNWASTTYSDAAWSNGQGGFGAGNPPNTDGLTRTTWNTSDIWLRRTFNPGSLTSQQISNLFFLVYHDEDVEIYINGVLAASATGYRTSYGLMNLTPAGRAAIIPDAVNLLAVHCHQTGGGQYIDVGLVVREGSSSAPSLPLPARPVGLQAKAGKLGISIGWQTSLNADNYLIKRSTVSGGPYTVVGSAAVNAFTDTSAVGGTTYFYVVCAVNPTGQSIDSAEISGQAPVLPGPQVRAWFRADGIGGLSNGQAVSVWQDVSGQGLNATQVVVARQPAYLPGAINGLPAVRFTATNTNYMEFPRPVQDDFTILFVYRSSQGIGTGTHFYQGAGLVNGEVPNTVNDFGMSLNANGRLLAGTGNPDRTIASGNSGFNNGQPHVVTFRRVRNNGALTLHVDGLLEGTATGGTQSLTATSRLVMGAQQTLINFLDGDIAEVKIFDSALSEAQRTAEESALMCKYGLGGGAPPAAPEHLSAAAGNRSVQLDWSSVMGAQSYTVSWSTNAAGLYETIGTGILQPQFTHATAVTGLDNYYKVVAVSACGQSAPATASVLLPQPKLTMVCGTTEFQLRWPSWASDWIVWSATNLTPPIVWSHLTNVPALSDEYVITLPYADGSQFFRLSSP